MSNFERQVGRMRSLMGFNTINENTNSGSHSIEYHIAGADGNVYGIIRENKKYYIKTTKPENENIAESYDYIGGICRKGDYEYNSYANAVKHLEMKLRSINEAVGKQANTQVIDPSKREILVIEGNEKMSRELARQRELMASVAGLNEEVTDKANRPYTEKGEAKLDKDFTAKADCPKKESDPYTEDPKKCSDGDCCGDKSCCKKDLECKPVKVNEEYEEYDVIDGEDEFDSDDDETIETDLDTTISDDMAEEAADEIVGQPDSDDSEDIEDNDDDDYGLDDDINGLNMDFDDVDNYSYDDEEEVDDELTDPELDDMDEIVESITRRVIREFDEMDIDTKRIRGNGIGIIPSGWFKSAGLYPFYDVYKRICNALGDIKSAKDPDEVNDVYSGVERRYVRLKRVIRALRNDEPLRMSPEEHDRLKGAIDSATDEDIDKMLKSLEDVWEGIVNVWDKKYALPADKKFTAKEKSWGKRRSELNYGKVYDDELDAIDQRDQEAGYGRDSYNPFKRKDREFAAESRRLKEEKTTLNDFGKHPGYRKKPFTLPSNATDENDWNDSSVDGEQPFGQKIGDGDPYKEDVKMITDAVFAQVKEMLKKKA